MRRSIPRSGEAWADFVRFSAKVARSEGKEKGGRKLGAGPRRQLNRWKKIKNERRGVYQSVRQAPVSLMKGSFVISVASKWRAVATISLSCISIFTAILSAILRISTSEQIGGDVGSNAT